MINSGKVGEEIAAAFLENKGFKILTRNFRIRGGEIDIIAIDHDVLVYIEVKTRTSHTFGLPEEAVNYYKLKFIERAAKFYRLKNKNLPEAERIDVIAVDMTNGKAEIKHIKNASF